MRRGFKRYRSITPLNFAEDGSQQSSISQWNSPVQTPQQGKPCQREELTDEEGEYDKI